MLLPVRKVLNLTYAWLFDLIGGTDEWKRRYEHIFDPNAHEDHDMVDLPASAVMTPEGKPRLLIGGA